MVPAMHQAFRKSDEVKPLKRGAPKAAIVKLVAINVRRSPSWRGALLLHYLLAFRCKKATHRERLFRPRREPTE